MQKSKLFALLGILAVFMMMIGCPTQGEEKKEEKKEDASKPTDKFVGSWASTYGDWFSLTSSGVFTCYNNGDETTDWNPVPNDIAYKGTIESYDVTGDYLLLNLKIVDPSRSPWGLGLAIGMYGRVVLKSINDTQCNMATASIGHGNWNDPDYYAEQTDDTIDGLKNKFTIENGSFGAINSVYTKKQ